MDQDDELVPFPQDLGMTLIFEKSLGLRIFNDLI